MPDPFRKTLAATMILAPLLGIVSAIASPPLRSGTEAQLAEITRHPDRWYVYALFITASCWLLVPAVIGLTAMLAGRAPRLSLLAGALSLLGVLVAVGDATTELMYWQMGAPGADRAQMVALSDRYDNAIGSSLVFTVGGLAVIVGLAILAVALWRERLAPAWASACLPVAAIVNIAGFSLSSNAIVTVSNVVFLVGFGWIGIRLLTAPASSAGRALQPHATTT
jgi:hypothetical protein